MKIIVNNLSIFIIILNFLTCKEKPVAKTDVPAKQNIQNTKAVVQFLVGDVKKDEKQVSIGQVLENGDKIIVGKKSYVDLQMIYSNSEAIIRVKSNSEFSFNSKKIKDGSENNFFVRLGTVIFNINKTNSKDEVKILTPGFDAGVRGTKFITTVTKDSKSSFELLEGSIAVKPNIQEIQNLPEEFIDKTPILKEINSKLESSEIVLEVGQKINLDKNIVQKFIKENKLEEITKLEELKTLEIGKEPDKLVLDDIAKKLETNSEKIQKKLAKATPIKLTSSPIQEKDIQNKLKEFEELVKIEKEKIENSNDIEGVVKTFNKSREKQIRKKIETIFNLETQVLVLKNGTKITGVIIQEGNKYIVLTPEGKKEVLKSESDGIELYEE